MSQETSDFTKPYQPSHVLNLVFGKIDFDTAQGQHYIEVWVKDPQSGIVSSKRFYAQDEQTFFNYMINTLRIMNLRNKASHSQQQSAIQAAKQPRPKKKPVSSSPQLNLNLEDLL